MANMETFFDRILKGCSEGKNSVTLGWKRMLFYTVKLKILS